MTETIELPEEDVDIFDGFQRFYIENPDPQFIGIGIEPNLLGGEDGIGNLAIDIGDPDANGSVSVEAERDLLLGILGVVICRLLIELDQASPEARQMIRIDYLQELGLVQEGRERNNAWDDGEPGGRAGFYESLEKKSAQLQRFCALVAKLAANS